MMRRLCEAAHLIGRCTSGMRQRLQRARVGAITCLRLRSFAEHLFEMCDALSKARLEIPIAGMKHALK